jgi:2-polyprenyl-3-methyl-5-hydroxy-6-metoxy-1,4-benzoquinol methylase
MESKEHFQQTISKWIEEERSWTCGQKSSDIYARNQDKRFQVTLDICKKHVPNQSAHVLDIGRSNLTNLLSQYYKDVSTLGFDLEKDDGGHRENIKIPNLPHIVYDLNESKNTGSWPNHPQVFDLIVFCETLEHLYTAPEYVLLMLKYLLSPTGIIVITTPNAVSFHKRVIYLRGKNPAERLRFYQMNPGDYRQYTRDEIIDIADKSGLRIVKCSNINFRSSKYAIIRLIQRIPNLKDSIYTVLSR